MNAAPPQVAESRGRRRCRGRRGSSCQRGHAGAAGAAAGAQFPARDHRRGQPHRQVRRARRHAVPAGAQRLPALRPRQVDHPELRARRREPRHAATCGTTTPIRSRRKSSSRTRSPSRSAGWATTGATHRYHASDYYGDLYRFAEWFIEHGLAYVDSQSAEEMRATRGTLTEPGLDSPYRNRSVAENLDLFRRMRAGEFPDGAHVLRLKIDMAQPEREHARSGDLPDPPRVAPPHRRHVVHLSALRLHALHLAMRSSASRIRSARSSSRITDRCTTG